MNVYRLFLVFFISILSTTVFADQLAYISRSEAEQASNYIRKHKKLILFCGCCDGSEPLLVKVTQVEVRYTGYETFYEVVITYQTESGLKSEAIDLAYVWDKKRRKTLGELLNLQHDPCNRLP